MPKVSVIMPTFNRIKYLCEAIDSVLAQTYKDYEIIVVDDGSMDDTKEALKCYGDRIRYFYCNNRGVAGARNFGINQASGEYIAFLDDDDLWLNDKLARQIPVLDNDHMLAFVCADTYVIDARGRVIKAWRKGVHNQETFGSLYESDFAYTLTVVARKSCLNEVGPFDEMLTGSEDYDMWLRLAKKYKFKHIPLFLAKYRLHENNQSKDYDLRLKKHKIIAAKPAIAAGISLIQRQRRAAKDYYMFGTHHYDARNFYKAGIYYLRAVLNFPFIGYYYWPEETNNFKFTLPYRILKVYLMIPICFLKILTYRFAPRLITKKESILSK